MKILKALTRWIWKDEIKSHASAIADKRQENAELVNSLAAIEKQNQRLTIAIRNIKDDMLDVTRGSAVENQAKEILKQYNV